MVTGSGRDTVSNAERRARIAVRHGVAAAHRFPDAVSATRAMTVLHATEPATVYLSLHQRVADLTVADVAAALYEERSLVKQLAMRRTLFVFPRDLLAAAWGSASARTHGSESRRLAKDAVRAGLTDDGDVWVRASRERILALLAEHPDGLTGVQLREHLPDLMGKAIRGGDATPFAHRLLTNLGASAHILRGHNDLHWRLSRPRWALTADWLDEVPEPLAETDGYAVLLRRWLDTFGPGTEDDIVWWFGATKGAVRRALADVGAVEVALEDGRAAWVNADDPVLDGSGTPAREWAALLPVLDPTVMGWKERDFYLGGHRDALFDTNGNAGTTAWWNGKIVGCWTQDADGTVALRPLVPLSASAQAALLVEVDRLSRWLDGIRVGTVYPAPAMRCDEADLPYPVLRA